MGDVRDTIHQLVSQFADDYLHSDEWALLSKLPPMSRIVSLHGISTLRGSDEPLPARLRQLTDDLSPLSPLRRDCLEARIEWFVNDLASAAARTGTAGVGGVVDDFITHFTAPTQQVLHSFTLGAFRVTGLSGSDPVQLVEDWKLHPRGMPLGSHASSLVSATETDEPPTSLTRFVDVPKGADPQQFLFLGRSYAQLILESLRLFALSGVFVAQEDFSPDYHYVGISHWNPATCPTTTVCRALPAARLPELAAFLTLWLQLTPTTKPVLLEKGPSRLRQALWHLKRAYDDSEWEHALLDAVSGLEFLLVGQNAELSYRLAIRAACLLSAPNPDEAEKVFATIRQLYGLRSCIAHGDWATAEKEAAKVLRGNGQADETAGAACATTAVDYLRRAILAAAFFESKGKDMRTVLDEKSLLNVAAREALRKSLDEDASNPLVQAMVA